MNIFYQNRCNYLKCWKSILAAKSESSTSFIFLLPYCLGHLNCFQTLHKLAPVGISCPKYMAIASQPIIVAFMNKFASQPLNLPSVLNQPIIVVFDLVNLWSLCSMLFLNFCCSETVIDLLLCFSLECPFLISNISSSMTLAKVYTCFLL